MNRYDIERFLRRHKVLRFICTIIAAIIGILIVIWIFSWDSLLGWIITKDKADMHQFIFWAIFAIVVLIASTFIAIVLTKKIENK